MLILNKIISKVLNLNFRSEYFLFNGSRGKIFFVSSLKTIVSGYIPCGKDWTYKIVLMFVDNVKGWKIKILPG